MVNVKRLTQPKFKHVGCLNAQRAINAYRAITKFHSITESSRKIHLNTDLSL